MGGGEGGVAKESVEAALRVAGIVEIQPWILSWGAAVEVLEPADLREAVATAVRIAAGRYAT